MTPVRLNLFFGPRICRCNRPDKRQLRSQPKTPTTSAALLQSRAEYSRMCLLGVVYLGFVVDATLPPEQMFLQQQEQQQQNSQQQLLHDQKLAEIQIQTTKEDAGSSKIFHTNKISRPNSNEQDLISRALGPVNFITQNIPPLPSSLPTSLENEVCVDAQKKKDEKST